MRPSEPGSQSFSESGTASSVVTAASNLFRKEVGTSLSDLQVRSAGPTCGIAYTSASAPGVGKDGLYFYPSLWIAQRCVSVDLLKYVIDLDTKVSAGERFRHDKTLP